MKKIIVVIMLVIICISLCACNKTFIDPFYTFNYAVLSHADGTEETIEIVSWKDFQDGDQIQFTDKDGTTYLTHANRVVLKTKWGLK